MAFLCALCPFDLNHLHGYLSINASMSSRVSQYLTNQKCNMVQILDDKVLTIHSFLGIEDQKEMILLALICPDFYQFGEKLFSIALTFILRYRYILFPYAVGHNCNTRGYIHCIKCWVKSFNLALHLFFLFIFPKLHKSVDTKKYWMMN